MKKKLIEAYENHEIDYTPLAMPDGRFAPYFLITEPGAPHRAPMTPPVVWRILHPTAPPAFGWTENHTRLEEEAAREGLAQGKVAVEQLRRR